MSSTAAAATWSASTSSSTRLRQLPRESLSSVGGRAAHAACRRIRSRPSFVPYAIPPPCTNARATDNQTLKPKLPTSWSPVTDLCAGGILSSTDFTHFAKANMPTFTNAYARRSHGIQKTNYTELVERVLGSEVAP